MNRVISTQLFEQAKNYFPGGVNSPVRAFLSVDDTPLFIKKGDGCMIWDEDDNSYIDFCASWGPLILGHNHPDIYKKIVENLSNGTTFGAPTRLENQLAELILTNNPFIEQIRFVSSGTEAVMSALRLARGYTKRNKIVKFEGCYHGHTDSMLVKAGSGLVTLGESSSAGVPPSYVQETIVLPLHDKEQLLNCFLSYSEQIACVIIEPIPANNGLLLQDVEFLRYLRDVCSQYGALLIFDEVISGFRVGFNGAADYYQIQPDLIIYGKIIGGGLPVAAYGGKHKIMQSIAPQGSVYQAGTLSGNPLAMAAGIAQLTHCLSEGFYETLAQKTDYFVSKINAYAQEHAYTCKVISIGSIFWVNFQGDKMIQRADDIAESVPQLFKKFHAHLLKNGVYIGPSAYEVGFISIAHTIEKLDEAIRVICSALDEVYR